MLGERGVVKEFLGTGEQTKKAGAAVESRYHF